MRLRAALTVEPRAVQNVYFVLLYEKFMRFLGVDQSECKACGAAVIVDDGRQAVLCM